MRIVDLSMTVEECDSAPFAPDEKYFKLKPIIKWEDKGFVSNVVEMTVHAGRAMRARRAKDNRHASSIAEDACLFCVNGGGRSL